MDGHILRPLDRGGHVRDEKLSEKVVWQLLQQYAAAAGVPSGDRHGDGRSGNGGNELLQSL